MPKATLFVCHKHFAPSSVPGYFSQAMPGIYLEDISASTITLSADPVLIDKQFWFPSVIMNVATIATSFE